MFLSIIIPTFNRAELVGDCLNSILKNPGKYEILIMDQSTDDTTERVARARGSPPLVRYRRLERKGASAAKNTAIKLSQGGSLLFTDDDCLVSPDWVRTVTELLEKNDQIQAISGRVLPAYDVKTQEGLQSGLKDEYAVPSRQSLPLKERKSETTGYSGLNWKPAEPRSIWLEEKERMFMGLTDPWQVGGGSGSNLAIRRESLESVGLFDERLGPGVPLRSGEDGDMIYRLLKGGSKILYSPEVLVYHRAWRNREENLRLSFSYGLGRGGFLVKHIAAGDIFARKLMIKLLAQTVKRLLNRRDKIVSVDASHFLAGLMLGQILMCHNLIGRKPSSTISLVGVQTRYFRP